MKAEHRKELETNTLADKMGQAVQRVKTGRRGTYLTYLLVVVAVLIGAWFLYAYVTASRQERSDAWLRFDDGSAKNLDYLSKIEPTTPAGKAARLQLAWVHYYHGGIKFMGTDPNGALQMLKIAGDEYRKLAEESKDTDPLVEPQALLGIAVVEEAKTIQDASFLDKAAEAYKAVLERGDQKYKDTVYGKFAQERLDQLKDAKKRAEIAALYTELQRDFRVRAAQPIHPDLPGMGKDLPPLQKQ